MRIFLVLFIACFAIADDFIDKNEYAKLLYQNPRGIGCNMCHGDNAKGSVIAKYKQKGEMKTLSAPPINNLSKERFFAALNDPKSVMPKYSLTTSEIESLYYYARLAK